MDVPTAGLFAAAPTEDDRYWLQALTFVSKHGTYSAHPSQVDAVTEQLSEPPCPDDVIRRTIQEMTGLDFSDVTSRTALLIILSDLNDR